jgi:hypothetical protein
MRAFPDSTRAASSLVASFVRMIPIRGSRTWRASGTPKLPAVTRNERLTRPRFLNRGHPIRLPSRTPERESKNPFNARARLSRPEEYASFE